MIYTPGSSKFGSKQRTTVRDWVVSQGGSEVGHTGPLQHQMGKSKEPRDHWQTHVPAPHRWCWHLQAAMQCLLSALNSWMYFQEVSFYLVKFLTVWIMTKTLFTVPGVKDLLDSDKFMLDMVTHTYNPSTQEAEAEGCKFKARLANISKF